MNFFFTAFSISQSWRVQPSLPNTLPPPTKLDLVVSHSDRVFTSDYLLYDSESASNHASIAISLRWLSYFTAWSCKSIKKQPLAWFTNFALFPQLYASRQQLHGILRTWVARSRVAQSKPRPRPVRGAPAVSNLPPFLIHSQTLLRPLIFEVGFKGYFLGGSVTLSLFENWYPMLLCS